MPNTHYKNPIICQRYFLQIIGWHVDFECDLTSRGKENDTQNMRGGMLTGGEELRDSSRAFRVLRQHGTYRHRVLLIGISR